MQVIRALSPLVGPGGIKDLDAIPAEMIWEDMHDYVFSKLRSLSHDPDDSWPPPEESLKLFLEHCGLLFELAAVRIRQLRSWDSQPLLEVFNEILEETNRLAPTLEKEYLRILHRGYPSFSGNYPPTSTPLYSRYRVFLGTLASLRAPLSVTA